ncbi:MAG TPA: hypothetical protein VE824_00170 [Gaiellales bacterium]|nr:hypothetical protein [Gaiellales bacterium]
MRSVNIHNVPLDRSQEQPGFSWTAAVLGPRIGAVEMGATLYELPPGQASFPYHYEYGCEEWLLVVTGTPTLRDPEGAHRLAVVALSGPNRETLIQRYERAAELLPFELTPVTAGALRYASPSQ